MEDHPLDAAASVGDRHHRGRLGHLGIVVRAEGVAQTLAAEEVQHRREVQLASLAAQTGARRQVLLSGRNEEGALRSEQLVRESGADWTIVRSSFFAQNFSEGFFVDPVVGEVAFPAGDVVEPFIDADDIADVAVAALTDDRHIFHCTR
jgi:uncharacterized protein YbjT (DUF2867 family)